MKNIDLLSKICETPGAPGFEQRIRALVLEEVKDIADEIEVDNMGNVYAILKENQTNGLWLLRTWTRSDSS